MFKKNTTGVIFYEGLDGLKIGFIWIVEIAINYADKKPLN
jgi:hypothetical protein